MSGNTARRTSTTYPNGRQVDLGYGAAGSIEDSFSLVKSVAIAGETGNKVDYTRVGLARFVKVAYPQPNVGMSMIRPGGGSEGDAGDPYDGFDRFSRTQAMRWEKTSDGSVLDGWKWGFNEASNRTWKKNLVAAIGQDEAYGYDRLYQVSRDAVGTLNTNRTAIGGIPGQEEGFTYDATGNWLAYRKDANGSPILDQTRSNNQDNQLVQIDGSSRGIEYDHVGNAVKIRPGLDGDWSKHFELVWDAWNRLVEVKDENGVTVQKNRYDGLTRRITKTAEGVDRHYYYNDRWKPVEERIDTATTAARSYLWGERPGHRDELMLRDRDTDGNGTLDERLYATMDYFNGTAILDVTGAVVERYAYAAFGPRRVMAPDFSPRTASDFDWNFGFQGQFRDAETGWHNYGYRFYVPLLGRWINRDPVHEHSFRKFDLHLPQSTVAAGLLYSEMVDALSLEELSRKFQGVGEMILDPTYSDINEYAFVKNSPLSFIDLFGLAPYNRCAFLRSKCDGYKTVRINLFYSLAVCIRRNCYWRCYCDENDNCPNIPCKDSKCPLDHGVEERVLTREATGPYGGVTPAACERTEATAKSRGNCKGGGSIE